MFVSFFVIKKIIENPNKQGQKTSVSIYYASKEQLSLTAIKRVSSVIDNFDGNLSSESQPKW